MLMRLYICISFLSIQIIVASANENEEKYWSTTQKVLVGSVVGVGVVGAVVVAAPVVLPTGAVVGAKAVAAAVSVKLAAIATPATVVTLKSVAAYTSMAGTACTVLGYFRYYVYPTDEQRLKKLKKEEAKEEAVFERDLAELAAQRKQLLYCGSLNQLTS